MKINFLQYKKNIYSQNGEDGIIEKIFNLIGTDSKICCEFGAWDGIYLSNARNLILNGWSAIMIESDFAKFNSLVKNYSDNKKVICVNKLVDANQNSLFRILKKIFPKNYQINIDFLSIDIDGLDYEIFQTIDVYPRVICIEVNAGHSPDASSLIQKELAKNNIGQPLKLFSDIAKTKGYELVCYTGNAFYIKKDILQKFNIDALSNKEAYIEFLNSLHQSGKERLFLVNLGLIGPFYKYNNLLLKNKKLKINLFKRLKLIIKSIFHGRKELFNKLIKF